MNKKFAFIFPGQGSQSIDMLNTFIEDEVVLGCFAEAKDVLGIDFLDMIVNKKEDLINQTIYTQPLLLITEYALYLYYISKGGTAPSVVAGHSLGEFSALVVSKVLTFNDALKLVSMRAKLMQEAVPSGTGGMIAVLGMSDDDIVSSCAEIQNNTNYIVSGVNFNAPNQVVVAGDIKAIELVSILLKEKGAKKIIPLNVSVPSHCMLMYQAAEKFATYVKSIDFKEAEIMLFHNVNASRSINIEELKDLIVKQLYSPVLWSKLVNNIFDDGIENFVECGPNKVLTNLNKRINSNIVSNSFATKIDIDNFILNLKV